ncbi:MAG: aldo/keto reductase, partial [Myxococcota bacterium]|nr:aldo/keto reductase [Myxococcota bacterium]
GYTYTADWQLQAEEHEVKDHRLDVLERQWGETQVLLGDHLDLYQVHSATLDSGVLDRPEVIDALRSRRESGTRTGISVSGPGQSDTLRRALEIHARDPWLDSVQATWNLLCPQAGPTLAEARALGIHILVKEGVANGRLTPRATEPLVRDILFGEADRLGTSPDALALATVLDQPFVDLVLSGATTVDQLHSNLGAMEIKLDPAARDRLHGLAQSPAEYWSRRSALPWN